MGGSSRQGPAVVLSLSAAWLIAAAVATAHNPVQGDNYYLEDVTDTYEFESDVPSWMRTAFNTAAQTYWPTNLDSLAPRWSPNPSSANLVSYLTNRSQTGDMTGLECDPDGTWIACVWYDSNGRWGAVEYVSASILPSSVESWCEQTLQTGCAQVKRVALHELGHVAGLARNGHPASGTGEAYTVMKKNTPLRPADGSHNGWNDSELGVCDLIELQREYDIDSFASGYADCVDHFTGGITNGKITTFVTMKVSTTFQCAGTPVTFSGLSSGDEPKPANLNYNDDDGALNQLAGHALQSRTITLRRNGNAVGNATVSGTGSWSLNHTSSAGTYAFDGRYAGETALAADTSNSINVTWSAGC